MDEGITVEQLNNVHFADGFLWAVSPESVITGVKQFTNVLSKL